MKTRDGNNSTRSPGAWMNSCTWGVLLCIIGGEATAAGRKPMAIESPIPETHERPVVDLTVEDLGPMNAPGGETIRLRDSLNSRLETVLVLQDQLTVTSVESPDDSLTQSLKTTVSEPLWDHPAVPSANLRLRIEGFSLVTGTRGNRMAYGFLPGTIPERGHEIDRYVFSPSLQERQEGLWKNTTGLELGEGFGFNAIFLFFKIKYATYEARLWLDALAYGLPGSPDIHKKLFLKASGGFFDVVAGYMGYEAGLSFARNDAMNKLLDQSTIKISNWFTPKVSLFPSQAMIFTKTDFNGKSGYLVTTAKQTRTPEGRVYCIVDRPSIKLIVTKTLRNGFFAEGLSSNSENIPYGTLLAAGAPCHESSSLVQKSSLSQLVDTEKETIEWDGGTIPKVKTLNQKVNEISWWTAFARQLAEVFTLPYRVWRYSQYDKSPDQANREFPHHAVQVALIDSGIDYNHPELRDQLALFRQGSKVFGLTDDYLGYDFVSFDNRTFDDHGHGTQMASALVQTLREQKAILPIKVFNPWGFTTRYAVRTGFQYALERGAKVLVFGASNCGLSRSVFQGWAEQLEKYKAVLIVGAGDESTSQDFLPCFPAALSRVSPRIISVAATTPIINGQNLNLAPRSNYGARTVDLVASPPISLAIPRNRRTSSYNSSGVAAAKTAAAYLNWIEQWGVPGEFPEKNAFLESLPSTPEARGWSINGRILR